MRVILFTLNNESDVDKILEQVWQYRLDGVIAAARLHDSQVQEFERRVVPLVFFNRNLNNRHVNAVCCNQEAAAAMLIDGLLSSGHRKIGLIGGPIDSVVGAERIDSSIARLKRHGIRPLWTDRGDYTYDGGREIFRENFRRRRSRPDAVLAANDAMALGCLDSARFDYGLSIPDDLSVVGFDGVEVATWASYQLATVKQPVKDMANAAVDLLMKCIEQPIRPPEQRVFIGTLERGSSARLTLRHEKISG